MICFEPPRLKARRSGRTQPHHAFVSSLVVFVLGPPGTAALLSQAVMLLRNRPVPQYLVFMTRWPCSSRVSVFRNWFTYQLAAMLSALSTHSFTYHIPCTLASQHCSKRVSFETQPRTRRLFPSTGPPVRGRCLHQSPAAPPLADLAAASERPRRS